MQVHHMMVHSAAHLPSKAAHSSGFRPHLLLELYTALQLLNMGRAGSLR